MKKASETKLSPKKAVPSSASRTFSSKSRLDKKGQAGLKGQRSVARLRKAAVPNARIGKSGGPGAGSGGFRRRSAGHSSRQVPARILNVNPVKTAPVRQYESAIKLLYSQDFVRAKAALERIVEAYPEDKELMVRVNSHLRLCEIKTSRRASAPKTVEDYYNMAVALMNGNRYEESREQLNKALKASPSCEYVIYALAALSSRSGDLDNALNYLKTAIKLKPENRFLAQNDSDFEPLRHDARFTSIVFPERMSG
jgi:tetratricopeptide (TPR) repeat protein